MSGSDDSTDKSFKIIRNPVVDTNTPVDNIELTYDSVSKFVVPRAFGSMIAGSIWGLSASYIAGEAIALPFYSWGIAGAIFGTTFHAGSYALRYYRKQDDLLNYASCGAIHGLFIGAARKGYRKGGMMGLGCGIGGALYYVGGEWLYDISRRAWISHRRNMALSVPRQPMAKVNPFEPRQYGLEEIPNRYTPIPDDDHSMIANARRYLQSLDKDKADSQKK